MFGFLVQRYKKSDKLASVLTETGVSSNLIDAKRGFFVDRPDTWSDCSSDNSLNVLVKVNESDDQYWDVAEQLHKNMPDAHISTVWRVQNEALWFYYSFQKQRLALNGIAANETAVWHGTSSTEPSVIHNDTQDGFMMQCARNGVWG
jgi:hypothetical protein